MTGTMNSGKGETALTSFNITSNLLALGLSEADVVRSPGILDSPSQVIDPHLSAVGGD